MTNSPCPNCSWHKNIQNDETELQQGSILAGQYLVWRVLGVGGFEITYIGWSKKVAIKEFFPYQDIVIS